jgi:hypothetical protein
MNDNFTPSRTYYTAREISDIALTWGARPTITDIDGHVVIDLEHQDSTMQLVLGSSSEFYDRMLCRTWVIVQGAPHQFCDEWNEDPEFGTFSVVYDDKGLPERNKFGFVVRAVQIIDFERCTSQEDIILQVALFWFGVNVIQEALAAGDDPRFRMTRETLSTGFANWWFGDESSHDTPDDTLE